MKTKLLKILKAVFITLSVIVVIFLGIILVINFLTKPVADEKRNLSETDAKINVEFNNKEEYRTPIIRTFKEEEYNNFTQKKINKVISTIDGNIEGDIPAVELKYEKAYINIDFIKNEKSIEPDTVPYIIIEIAEEDSNDIDYQMKEAVRDKLEIKNGQYRYKLDRYSPQYDKYFIHYNLIKIYYSIDKEDYISLFALNTTNADEDVDWFEDNEELENPIDIE